MIATRITAPMRTLAAGLSIVSAGYGRGGRTLVIGALGALLLAACSNSKLVVGPLYNRLDNRMEGRFAELADFNEEQTARAQELIGTFHVWHRQSELPRYASFLQRVSHRLTENKQVTALDVKTWFATVRHHSERLRACYPVNFAAGLLRTFSDEQLAAARRTIDERHLERVQEYRERTPAQRRERRAERIIGWAKRVGVELDRKQRELVHATVARQISLREQHFAGYAEWNQQLFDLLENRGNANFAAELQAHLAAMYTWLQRDHADAWQANQALWQAFMLELTHSLTIAQRQSVAAWMRKMAETLSAVSADEPGFRVSGDPALGCRVSSGAEGA